jgi:uncharacterized protein (DUF58 family)
MHSGVVLTLADLIQLRHQILKIKQSTFVKAQAIESGAYHSRFKGRGMDFSQVRAYQPGDDMRHMDWRVTARMQKPHVKCYEEERQRPVFFVIDQSMRMRFGTRVQLKSVLAARLCAILAWTMALQGDRVGGIVFSEENSVALRPQAHQHGVLPLLKIIVAMHAKMNFENNAIHLADALLRLRHVAKQRSCVFIISDFLTSMETVAQQLSRLKKDHDCILIRLIDPVEKHAPFLGRYPITDGQSEQVLDLSSRAAQENYEEYFSQVTTRYLALGKCLAIPTLTVSTADDLTVAVHNILKGD